MKRFLVLLLLAALLLPAAYAEEADPAAEMVEKLFAAMAGTVYDAEAELRKDMTAEEAEIRNAENAAYRAAVLPWLAEVFRMDDPAEETEPQPTQKPSLPEETDVPDREELLKAAYAALQQRETGAEYLRFTGAEDMDGAIAVTREYVSEWLAQVDHVSLKTMNDDYLCWLYCPDSMVDYPVVQAEDNSKYLHRMFGGDYNSAGTLFADYRNLPDFEDPNTLIYGHHMRNGSMFGVLVNYAEQAFFESHPYWLAMRENEIDLIELFAGYTTGRDDHCYDIAISDENDMRLFIEEACAKSDFSNELQFEADDHLVTLSTCAYAFRNARYIAIGRFVPLWMNAEPEEAQYSEPQE